MCPFSHFQHNNCCIYNHLEGLTSQNPQGGWLGPKTMTFHDLYLQLVAVYSINYNVYIVLSPFLSFWLLEKQRKPRTNFLIILKHVLLFLMHFQGLQLHSNLDIILNNSCSTLPSWIIVHQIDCHLKSKIDINKYNHIG